MIVERLDPAKPLAGDLADRLQDGRLEHIGGVATFANGGKSARPYAIVDVLNSKGELVYSRERDEPEAPQLVSTRVAEQMKAGNSWINAHNLFPHGVPYGGIGKSGLGGGVNSPETLFDYWRSVSVVRPL